MTTQGFKTVEFSFLPNYLMQDAIDLANEHENANCEYDAEDVSDDFVFEYDEENDQLGEAIYRRFQDGGLAY